jgi:hypothetical protein
MAKNTRVFHVVSRFAMKHSDVEKGIAQCALAWVEPGVSFRTLTEEEAIAARNEQARLSEVAPAAEIGGLRFIPPADTTYRPPRSREYLEGLDSPMFFRQCRWPREECHA